MSSPAFPPAPSLTHLVPDRRTGYTPPLGLITRASLSDVREQAALFTDPLIRTLMDSVTNLVLILNRHRQILFANRQMLDMLHLEAADAILGVRPGELFQCEHARSATHGCGTSEACTQCGALKVILAGLDGVRGVEECRITRRNDELVEAFDLKVCGSPFEHKGDAFVVFAIMDISHEKRRRALERIFFHDILNTVGSLRNLVELACEQSAPAAQEELQLVQQFFQGMVDEIQAQKLLLDAENDELQAQMQWLHSREVMLATISSMRGNDAARGRTIELDAQSVSCPFKSDNTLLRRVLSNMLKNALEAEEEGAVIRMGSTVDPNDPERIVFWVHNPSVIPRTAALQIFQRSFTTKGAGRGLGTYSIKLLTERYLKGRASFVSWEGAGTTFTIRLPLEAMCH
ncbi:ATP-binding protein [Megalodesulfovibrio gigas]|uniref:histidine kinase n=1 Tax=Megalodesulfovibrio gigas (strain ATCC 19364 / DSM 1382 / NCIMB 9332 / VKM B-1759) TaxID=1121448 RepID=T2GEA4_MEGG1|nr:ATP-binding protein [Megalodesulfovibrio gigas]AGW14930.1 putative PAS/PAC sensor signal transduction histidine kinase [Megalodesulfovibrio gigas DSM 1382 = ATCC 19364]